MDLKEIGIMLEKMREIIAEQLNCDAESIQPEMNIP